MGIKIGVCEDDVFQRSLLVDIIKKFSKKENTILDIYEFSTGEELITNYPTDLNILFLDINMGQLSGMDASRKIREFDNKVEIIFTTAMSDYVFEGYEVRAYRYLVKPINGDRLYKILSECLDNLSHSLDNIIMVNLKNTVKRIDLDYVNYIEVDGRNLIIHEDNVSYKLKMSMKQMEKVLKDKHFFRCHNSFIINLSKIESLEKNTAYINGKYIPISKYRLVALKKELINCLGEIIC